MSLVQYIPCSLRDPIYRASVQKTFKQILDRYPKDFIRLQKSVREIQPYDDAGEGVMGIWEKDVLMNDDPDIWRYSEDNARGVIKINETIHVNELPGYVAHELGHAATRHIDRIRRGPISDVWQSELAADWYAYKWGFGRFRRRLRETRDHLHHGAAPGEVFGASDGEKMCKYRLTRNFVAHLMDTSHKSG